MLLKALLPVLRMSFLFDEAPQCSNLNDCVYSPLQSPIYLCINNTSHKIPTLENRLYTTPQRLQPTSTGFFLGLGAWRFALWESAERSLPDLQPQTLRLKSHIRSINLKTRTYTLNLTFNRQTLNLYVYIYICRYIEAPSILHPKS